MNARLTVLRTASPNASVPSPSTREVVPEVLKDLIGAKRVLACTASRDWSPRCYSTNSLVSGIKLIEIKLPAMAFKRE